MSAKASTQANTLWFRTLGAHTRRTIALIRVAIIGIAVACGGDSGGTGVVDPPPSSPTLTISVPDTAIPTGFAVRAVVTERDAQGTAVATTGAAWTSSNSGVFTVATDGTITAVGAGTGTLSVAVNGGTATLALSVISPAPGRPVFSQLFAAGHYSCGQSAVSGGWYCWGGSPTSYVTTPTALNTGAYHLITLTGNAQQLLCGTTSDGTVACANHQFSSAPSFAAWLADPKFGTEYGTLRPSATGPGGIVIVSVVVGADDVCGLTALGAAYCQGLNSRGQLGDGIRGQQPSGAFWVPVSGGLTFTSLAASAETTCGTTTQEQLYCWGADNALLPGDSAAASDELVPTLRANGAYVRLVGSLGPICALDTGGRVQCFGTANSTGLLTGPLMPMFNGQTMASVTVGEWHVCGISTAGTPLCTSTAPVDDPADQGYGALRDVAPAQQSVGTPVALRMLSAGTSHTCALDAQGHAWCWGTNSSGELGDGTLVTRAGPVSVTGQAP